MNIPVIQFATLGEFLAEMAQRNSDVVRVWLSEWGVGGGPVTRFFHGVTCQSILLSPQGHPSAIAQVNLVMGTYDTCYGKPFGPDSERRHEVIRAHRDEAVDLVRVHISDLGFAVGDGNVFTGLSGNQIQPAYWARLDNIYEELK